MKEHDQLREALHAYRDGELDAASSAAVGEHLRACADCREDLAAWERFAAAAFKAPEPIPGFVGGVMSRIAEEELAADKPLGFGWWLTPGFALAAGLAVLFWPDASFPTAEQLLLSEAPALSFTNEGMDEEDVLALVMEDPR